MCCRQPVVEFFLTFRRCHNNQLVLYLNWECNIAEQNFLFLLRNSAIFCVNFGEQDFFERKKVVISSEIFGLNPHLSKCSLGYYHNLEILRQCPQREFLSLNLSSPQRVIGQISSPNQAKSASIAGTLGFSREVPAKYKCTNTQWSNIEMKPRKRTNDLQIEKKAQREANRIYQVQQRKLGKELTNGMALRNAALEQLAHKINEEEIITVSAKAAACR